MKLLHTSDWHLGKSLYDFSLLEDQRHMLEGLIALIADRGVDAVVLAGDVYDRPVPSAQAVALYDEYLCRAVAELGVPLLAVAGNHDSPGRLSFGSSLYRESGYHICGLPAAEIETVTLADEHGPVVFWLIPFLQPADVRALFPQRTVRTYDDAYRVLLEENAHRMDTAVRNVAVAHGFFSPIGPGRDLLTSDSEVNIGGMDIADSGVFAPFDYTALGHLHAPQRAGSETVRYSGSPLKYSLSEERQKKGHTLVELGKKGEIAATQVPVKALRDVRAVTGALDELLEPQNHTNQSFDDYVFAYLTDPAALYPMEKLRRLFPHLLGLRLSGEGGGAAPAVQVGGGVPSLSPEEMFHRFYRECRGADMPADARAFLRDAIERAREEEAAL